MIKSVKRKLIKKIAQRYSLELILLFGSRAAGNAYQSSDFDIAYISKKELNLEEEARLICDLMLIFKNKNIDLVNLKKASPLLFYAIFKDCQVLFESKPLLFDALRAYSFKKYIETKTLYKERFRRIQEKIKKIKV